MMLCHCAACDRRYFGQTGGLSSTVQRACPGNRQRALLWWYAAMHPACHFRDIAEQLPCLTKVAHPLACALPHMVNYDTAGARLGTYSPIKRAMGGDEDHISLLRNLVAGSVSGGFAAAVTNPLDLVKTRLQSKDNPYKTIGQVVKAVVKDEGIVGLWAGTMPSVVSFIHLQT